MLDNQKFFAQGWVEDGNHILSIERWIPRSEGYFWVCKDPGNYPIERFLTDKIFQGKSFADVADKIEWVSD